MNTPEPLHQPGQFPEKNMPYPLNPAFPPQRAQNQGYPPFTPPTSPPSLWNGSGMPNATGNPGMPQTGGGQNSGYLSPSHPFTPPATTTTSWSNQWANGTNTTGLGSNSFPPPSTPTPSNNKSPLNAKPTSQNTSRVGKILLFVGLALLLITTSVGGVYMLGSSAYTPSSTAKTQLTALPTPTPTPTIHMQHQQLVTQYVANMSLDDEIAQLLMIEHDYAGYTPDLNIMMNQQHVGSVILYKAAIATRAQVKSLISDMQQNSTIPVFVSIDEEGWNVGRLKALYPNYASYRMDAYSIARTGDPNIAAQQGQQAGQDLLSLGINMNLAPDVDVSTDDGYIGYDRRSFGSTPDAVIKYAGPYLKALQTAGVVGSVKHFPGLGSIPKGFDPHFVLPVYTGTKDQLYQNDLAPFKYFIQNTDSYQQAYVVMPTDMLVKSIDPIYPVELSHTFITDILRNELGFKGVILSDSLHMGGVLVNGQVLSLAEACVLALQAGNDILEGATTSTEVKSIIDAVKLAIQSGQLTKAQIGASVTRVLTLKMDFNVMSAVAPSSATPIPTATAPQG